MENETYKQIKIAQLKILIEQEGICNGIPCEICFLYKSYSNSPCQKVGVFSHDKKLKFAKDLLLKINFELI